MSDSDVSRVPLQPGSRLGAYEIVASVSSGDDAELYKATDTELNRDVSIQVFPQQFTEPFEARAKVASTLSHPNIRALHAIGHEEGRDFLVLEYVEGKTLAQRLESGAMELQEAITTAMAIADALEKAHMQGVVHGDLNPAKIVLTESGPKLLDFGLAETKPQSSASAAQKSATGPEPSIQYLSPEQLEGKEPEARSDIFAFGAIFYEMITGKRAFEGKSRAILIATIATGDPDPISQSQPKATAALEHIVERCLAKAPDDRWQTAHDLLLQLRWVTEGGKAVGAIALGAREKALRFGLAAAALLILVLSLPAALYLRGPGQQAAFVFRVPVRGLSTSDFALSPDGSAIALVARPMSGEAGSLYVRRTGSLTFTKLAGTDDASQPFWSPDSRYIGFVAGGRLKQVSAEGGAPKDIAPVQGFAGGTWSKTGTILFGTPKGVMRVSAEGGSPKAVTTLDAQESGHYWPNFLPDGKHFLYLVWAEQPANRATFAAALDSKEKTRVMQGESNTQYASPGYLVFHRDASLFAQPFDLKKLAPAGEPMHIADQVGSSTSNGHGSFDVAQNGSLIYFQGAAQASGRGGIIAGSNLQFGWVDRSGIQKEYAGEAGSYGDLDASPDGKLIAITKQDAAGPTADIWVIDWQRAGVQTRLTQDPGDDFNPVWAPDGKRVAFTTYRKGNADIYVTENGSGVAKETPLLESGADELVEDWSKDGKYIAYLTGPEDARDIWALPLTDGKPDPAKKPFPVVEGRYKKDEPQFSYDGKWLAYVSDRTVPGTFQVYVRSFPSGDQEIPVTVAGGGQPRWKGDGKELYYRAPDDNIMVVEMKLGSKLEASVPRVLFRAALATTESRNPLRHVFSVTPDGKRFLMRVPPGGTGGATNRSATFGNRSVPEVPIQSSAAVSGPAGGPGPSSGGTPIIGVNGLTVIRHWPSALEKVDQ